MKAGTPEGLSEPKNHWHITMTLQGLPARRGSSQGTAVCELVTLFSYQQLDWTHNSSFINQRCCKKHWL